MVNDNDIDLFLISVYFTISLAMRTYKGYN